MASNDNNTNLKSVGRWLIIGGIGGFALSVIFGFIPNLWRESAGALPAISFFLVLLGMAFFFPDMLQDSSGALSTMRIVVFMVVCTFVIIAIKLGWEAKSFDDFRIDRTWVYILGLAFGSKVFQSFTENSGNNTDDKDKTNDGQGK